jgi:hypothetical protein
MEKEFIPYKEALAMKELGFDEECLNYYNEHKILGFLGRNLSIPKNEMEVEAPLYQQAFRWFREKHNLKSFPVYKGLTNDSKEWWDWFIIGEEITYNTSGTYEEVKLDCLKRLIEIVKEKQTFENKCTHCQKPYDNDEFGIMGICGECAY